MLNKLNSGLKIYPLMVATAFLLFVTTAYASLPIVDPDSDLSSNQSYTSDSSSEDESNNLRSQSASLFEIFHFEDNSKFEIEETWLMTAAEIGCAEDQYALGIFYKLHPEQPEHIRNAYKWLVKAADQHHSKAHYRLGKMFEAREVNDEHGLSYMYRALTEYQKAADLNHVNAQYKVGIMYRYGHGINVNYEFAQKYLELAINNNFSDAEIEWIKMYEGNLLSCKESSHKNYEMIEIRQKIRKESIRYLNKRKQCD